MHESLCVSTYRYCYKPISVERLPQALGLYRNADDVSGDQRLHRPGCEDLNGHFAAVFDKPGDPEPEATRRSPGQRARHRKMARVIVSSVLGGLVEAAPALQISLRDFTALAETCRSLWAQCRQQLRIEYQLHLLSVARTPHRRTSSTI